MPVKKIEKNGFLLRCWEVFHLNGYHHTSMQDLAQATGLQKAGLYHHYPTKQALMEQVIAFAHDQFHQYALSVADDLSLPPEQRLEKLLRRTKRLATLHRRGCFFANIALETGRDDLFNHPLKKAMEDWAVAVGRLLEHFMPALQAKQQALQMIMEYEGAVLFYKLSGDEQYLEDFVERSIRKIGFEPQKQQISRMIIPNN